MRAAEGARELDVRANGGGNLVDVERESGMAGAPARLFHAERALLHGSRLRLAFGPTLEVARGHRRCGTAPAAGSACIPDSSPRPTAQAQPSRRSARRTR